MKTWMKLTTQLSMSDIKAFLSKFSLVIWVNCS